MLESSWVDIQIIIRFDALHNGIYPELFEPEIHERTFLFAAWVREIISSGGCDGTNCDECELNVPPEEPSLLVEDIFNILRREMNDLRRN